MSKANIEITPASRKLSILDSLNNNMEIRVKDLSEQFGTSVVTIRKDLEQLEKEGFLERVHGGAIKSFLAYQTLEYADRKNAKALEKKKIAVAASSLINDGDSVIINVGSTSHCVTQQLKNKKNLIVITNALMILNELSLHKNITTIFLGGRFAHDMQLTNGDDTMEQISKYTADKLIIGMDGIDIDAGATTYNHVEDTIMRMMMERSKEKILVVDDSKFGRVTFAHIAPLTAFDTIVTNYTPDLEDYYKKLRSMGINVITSE